MSLSDPIGDMIARVKNAQDRSHKKVELPSSNFKIKIADILKNEGFIKDFKVNKENIDAISSINPILITALNNIIGYEKGAYIAEKAYKEKKPIIDIDLSETSLSKKELEKLLNPKDLTKKGIK
mgnify:CR=1 FL=1